MTPVHSTCSASFWSWWVVPKWWLVSWPCKNDVLDGHVVIFHGIGAKVSFSSSFFLLFRESFSFWPRFSNHSLPGPYHRRQWERCLLLLSLFCVLSESHYMCLLQPPVYDWLGLVDPCFGRRWSFVHSSFRLNVTSDHRFVLLFFPPNTNFLRWIFFFWTDTCNHHILLGPRDSDTHWSLVLHE